MSSGYLGTYEYLTGEDLDSKPSTVDQARFEYSPLSKFLNKGLKRRRQKRRTFEDTEKYWTEEWRAVKRNWESKNGTNAKDSRQLSLKTLWFMTLNNFYKYRLTEFNKISLIDSEFDMIEKGYKDFIHLMDVDS